MRSAIDKREITHSLITYDSKHEGIYEEMLYEIFNTIGMPDHAVCEESLLMFLQNAFKFPFNTHVSLIKTAKTRPPRALKLNVEIVEAKNLSPKDSNGLADPFVTLFLASDPSPTGSYETEWKPETLEPVWKEKCEFVLEKDFKKEVLIVQIWDFDPAETASEKLKKIYDVKGVKGFGIFLKEIVGPSGKERNELIGSVDIPICKLQTTGPEQWFKLKKPESGNEKGTIKLALSFGSTRDIQVVTKEHKILVQQFLLDELEVSKNAPYQCIGKFCAQADNLLTQHAVQGGMSLIDTIFARWDVFCEVHAKYCLSFAAFNDLLEVLTVPIQNKENVSDKNVRMFWKKLVALLPSAFQWVQNLSDHRILPNILNFFAKVECLERPNYIELYPKELYGWLPENFDKTSWNLKKLLKIIVQSSSNQVLVCHLNAAQTQKEGGQILIKISDLDHSDSEKPISNYERKFKINEQKMAESNVAVIDSDNDEPESSYLRTTYDSNNDDIYEEMLYETFNSIGTSEHAVCEESILTYLQNAFKFPFKTNTDLLKSAKAKPPPSLKLNVEIVKAKNLPPKDSNGLADPFVRLFLASDPSPTGTYNTVWKAETLTPEWNEKCEFVIGKDAQKEVLIVQVWDFDPAQSTSEKLSKISDVKSMKGFGKFLKEMVGPSGEEMNELMGSINIPIAKVPASGCEQWFTLTKSESGKEKSTIKLALSFGSNRNDVQIVTKEHRVLVKQFLMDELAVSKVEPYQCSGNLCAQADNLLTQHAVQGGLSLLDMSFVKWDVFCEVHAKYSLSFVVFNELLDQLTVAIQNKHNVTDVNLRMFWERLVVLLPTAFSCLYNLHKLSLKGKNELRLLSDILKFLVKVEPLAPPKDMELFPEQLYGWLEDSFDKTNWNFHELLKLTVQSSSKSWFRELLACQSNAVQTQEEGLQNFINIVEIVRSDFEKAISCYEALFQTIKGFQYAQNVFQVYDDELDAVIKPFVTVICGKLEPVNAIQEDGKEADVQVGSTLFQLYVELRRLSEHGVKVNDNNVNLKLSSCHLWFLAGVQHWLDISVYKAKIRIGKAIELDNLMPIDENTRLSTSAVDTVSIFYQILVFWQQLEWPDVQSAFAFVKKIIEDICFCCDFYANQMAAKADALEKVDDGGGTKKFVVTTEWCCAINDLYYIRSNLEKIVEDFEVQAIIDRLPDMDKESSAETLNAIYTAALAREQTHITKFIDELAARMAPNLQLYLTDGAASLQTNCESMDKLMEYLADSLTTLNGELNIQNFERVMDTMWLEICRILDNKIKFSSLIDKNTQSSLYSNLLKSVNLLLEHFECTHVKSEECLCKEALESTLKKLQIYGYTTDELIHQYYSDRLIVQQQTTDASKYGTITIKCGVKGETLQVNIMSARNLLPMNPDGQANVYAKVYLLPAYKFPNVNILKTKCFSKNLCPLFDEDFEIPIKAEKSEIENAILMIRVKDRRFFGFRNRYLADCLVSFSSISQNGGSQIQLQLSRPETLDSCCIEALNSRKTDKKAKALLKKIKAEQHPTNNLMQKSV